MALRPIKRVVLLLVIVLVTAGVVAGLFLFGREPEPTPLSEVVFQLEDFPPGWRLERFEDSNPNSPLNVCWRTHVYEPAPKERTYGGSDRFRQDDRTARSFVWRLSSTEGAERVLGSIRPLRGCIAPEGASDIGSLSFEEFGDETQALHFVFEERVNETVFVRDGPLLAIGVFWGDVPITIEVDLMTKMAERLEGAR